MLSVLAHFVFRESGDKFALEIERGQRGTTEAQLQAYLKGVEMDWKRGFLDRRGPSAGFRRPAWQKAG